jgi:hypothetical protein
LGRILPNKLSQTNICLCGGQRKRTRLVASFFNYSPHSPLYNAKKLDGLNFVARVIISSAPIDLLTAAKVAPCCRCNSASRSLFMICSGVYPFFAILSPFYKIISGIVYDGQVTLLCFSPCARVFNLAVLLLPGLLGFQFLFDCDREATL